VALGESPESLVEHGWLARKHLKAVEIAIGEG